MKSKERENVGRLAGEEIAASVADQPSSFEKAVDVVLGAIAVLEPKGIRVTVPMLIKNPRVSEFLKNEEIGEPTLRAATTEARKRWVAAQVAEREEALKQPKKRRGKSAPDKGVATPSDAQAAPASKTQGTSSKLQTTGDRPVVKTVDRQPRDQQSPQNARDLFGPSGFVEDVPIDQL